MATKIVCKAKDCIFNENSVCTSDEITYDPEEGCLTYEVLDELDLDDEDWEDEDDILDDEDDIDWDDDDDDDLFMDDEDDLSDDLGWKKF